MIKARSLEATLPAIIFIHDVYMSLLEQNHQEEAGVREPYKMYKNATRTRHSWSLRPVTMRSLRWTVFRKLISTFS